MDLDKPYSTIMLPFRDLLVLPVDVATQGVADELACALDAQPVLEDAAIENMELTEFDFEPLDIDDILLPITGACCMEEEEVLRVVSDLPICSN